MTDKEQIMINDVDVSECIDFNKRDKISCYHLLYDKCDEVPNCYFKQLARKTQECEELKIKLMQKDEVNTFFNTPIEGWSSNPCDICESKNNYEQLKQECEELKERLDRTEEDLKYQCVDCMNCQSDRYRKALGEIEEIVKSLNENRMCFYDDINDCSNCDMNTDCNYLRKSKILDIINEAKDTTNE